MARYRAVQQAFTGGMLDPMIEANILSSQRQLGVKKSRNFWHRPDGPVQKRAGITPFEGFGRLSGNASAIDIDAAIRIDMPMQACLVGFINHSSSTSIVFEYCGLSGTYEVTGEAFQMDHSLSHFAVTVEQTEADGESRTSYLIAETQTGHKPVMYRITILDDPKTDGQLTMKFDSIEPEFTAYDWDRWPSTCCFAGGRLFLGFDDTVVASRTPEDGKNRFTDFTLADWSYSWKFDSDTVLMAIDKPVVERDYDSTNTDSITYDYTRTWNRSEQIWMESDSGYTSVDDSSSIVKKVITLRRHEIRLYDPDDESSYLTRKYLYHYITDDGDWAKIKNKDVTVWERLFTINLHTTASGTIGWVAFLADPETDSDEYKIYSVYSESTTPGIIGPISDLPSGYTPALPSVYGEIYAMPFYPMDNSDDVALFDIEMTITENWVNGEVSSRSVVKTETRVDTTSFTYTSGGSFFPSDPTIEDLTYTRTDETKSPTVYSSHAIELHETDMFGSSIQWIANIGRIVVATENALYISTSELFTPDTFDLVPSIYTGSAPMQPALIGSMLSFVTADRRRIYGAVYSNEIQGLTGIELSSSARSLFYRKIKWLKGSDSPFLSLYAITEDGMLLEGNIISSETGIGVAWSEWAFAKGVPEMAMPMRKLCSPRFDIDESPWIYLKMRLEDGSVYNAILEHAEPYAYGLDAPVAEPVHHAMAFNELPMDCQTAFTADRQPEEGLWRLGPYKESLLIHGEYDAFKDGDRVSALLCSLSWKPVAFTMEAYISEKTDSEGNRVLYLSLPAGLDRTAAGLAIIGFPVDARIQLFQQLLPNNSGIMLMQRHSIVRFEAQLFRSVGGTVYYNGRKVRDLLQFQYGRNTFGSDAIDPETGGFYAFTGPYGVDNPTDITERDELEIASSEPFPFNLMAVGLLYSITEVN